MLTEMRDVNADPMASAVGKSQRIGIGFARRDNTTRIKISERVVIVT